MTVTPLLRLIAVALLATCGAALLSHAAYAAPLHPDACKALDAQRQALFTGDIKSALERGPDWVKDHLHSPGQIEMVRQYLLVEEKLKFRCRTDGVVMPKPHQVPLPDRKPPVPLHQIAMDESNKVLANAAAASLLPLRKPSLSEPELADAGDTAEGLDDDAGEEPEQGLADAESGETTSSIEPHPGSSQTVADSDKTASPKIKETQ